MKDPIEQVRAAILRDLLICHARLVLNDGYDLLKLHDPLTGRRLRRALTRLAKQADRAELTGKGRRK